MHNKAIYLSNILCQNSTVIYNIIGHFRSCYRTPHADSVLCGANYSDLWKCRVEDWSNKEGKIMFFLESLGKSTAQHTSPGNFE